jgi:hypothetical protein
MEIKPMITLMWLSQLVLEWLLLVTLKRLEPNFFCFFLSPVFSAAWMVVFELGRSFGDFCFTLVRN